MKSKFKSLVMSFDFRISIQAMEPTGALFVWASIN